MTSLAFTNRGFAFSVLGKVWQALVPLWLFLACVIMHAGCTCRAAEQPENRPILACIPQHSSLRISPPLTSRTTIAGTIPVSFSITDLGDAALTIPIAAPPGRAGVEPALAISYNSSSGDGLLGVGFSLSGPSAITRCPMTIAVDGEIRAVQYDKNDVLCLDGKRLVSVAKNGATTEYRTFPDTQVKVVGSYASGFDAFLPSGWVVEYGKAPGARPLALGGLPRAWLASEMRDARGNAMTYGYCFAEAEGYTAEYAIDEIRYTSFEGMEATRAVAFVYGVKDEARQFFSGGMQLQQSLQLDEIDTHAQDELVRRYLFDYERSETTRRSRLASVEECGADGTCKPPTRFQYANKETGFEETATTIPAPTSRFSSPILADFNGDGLDDLLSPDTNSLSTPSSPITAWRIARNQGSGFAPESVAFSQEWSFAQDPQGPADPSLIQPELGTAIDYNQDGRTDVLLHDVYGNRNNHIVLISKQDGSFEEFDTGIKRPFPLLATPRQLRGSAGSVHLADVDGDGVADLIQCEDHADSPEGNPSQSSWALHLWQPGGFEHNGVTIDVLAGMSCGVELRTVDLNRNGKVDLVLPAMISIGGNPAVQASTYSAIERNADGTWSAWDTKLRIPSSPGRVIFADVNGDGLPDAVSNGRSDGRLYTWTNTGTTFSEKPDHSLHWDGTTAQDAYFHLATPLDFDGDGQTDLLMPMSNPPELPKWFVLRASHGAKEFTFERMDSGIPFEAQLGEAVTLADPRGPRVGDVNGDGAPDVAIFLANELHVFKNRAANSDVLVGFSDGMNEHDPDEPGFIPNVSFSYGHLIDGEAQESSFYLSHADPNNNCDYPRRCAVGARRVVREYATNDGQGGVRRFGLRYRDGRYDRRGYGFLGFDERLLTDLDTGATTATFYDNNSIVKVGERDVYPFAGQLAQQWRWAPALPNEPNPNRVELALVDVTSDVVPTKDSQNYFTLPTKRRTRRVQGVIPAGQSLETWVAEIAASNNVTMLRDTTMRVLDYDDHRNVLEVDVQTVGVDLTLHMERTVHNDTVRWILGQTQLQKECSSASGLSQCRTFTRTTNTHGEVETESTSSDENILDTKLDVTYERDQFGNITHVTADDALGHHRESKTIYDNEGILPSKHINALGHETTQAYDAALGVLVKQIDPNQLVSEWQYDRLGRLEAEKRPDGTQTITVVTREKVGDAWQLKQRTTTTGGADDETIYDGLGRPIRTFTHGPTPSGKNNAPRIMQITEYDRLSGQIAKKSVPIAEGTLEAALRWDSYEFDSIGRQIRHATPWNATTTTAYDGFVIDSTDPLLNHTKTELDPLGRPKIITDAANGQTKYTYGPFDTLYTVTDPGGATTKWTRDAFGRVRQLDEPDRGTALLVHNGFGDLLAMTDALGRVTTFGFDALGRTVTRTDKSGAQVLTTTWTWDTATNGVGRLHEVTSPDGVKSYSYTKRGQLEGMMLAVTGQSFASHVKYDGFGRLKSIDYPSPLGVQSFSVTHEYDDHGFRIGVHDSATSNAFWQLADVDDTGRYQKELFGNGAVTTRSYFDDKPALKSLTTSKGATNIQKLAYDYDARLNLKSRMDALQQVNTTERFRYDAVERLTCAYFGLFENSLAPCTTSYAYAPNGNLTSKSDIGALSYTDPKHPHAVTNGAGKSFGYDEVGNQITRPGGVTVTYMPFDLPRTITQGATSISFGYDGDQQRIRKTTPTTETLYFDNLYEQAKTVGGIEHRYYVSSPERAIAIVTRGGAAPGTRYLHVDHLGSVDAITDDKGIVEKRSYDAFGARRNPKWGEPLGVFTSNTTKGFTGHEADDELGLVNMKGRLYDPRIARFTTTDPVIADMHFGQSFNAYSYVWNNPLTFVDPSGFTPNSPSTTIPGVFCCIEQIIETKYPDGFVLEPVLENPYDAVESTNSLRFGADVDTTGNGASGLPQDTTEPESTSWLDNPFAQLIGGYLIGVGEGLVPFGGLGHQLAESLGVSERGTPQARFGLAVGQIVGGIFATVGGVGGEVLGGAATVSGIGAAAGVPVMVVSTAVVTGGLANIGAGIRGITQVLMEGGIGGGGARRPAEAAEAGKPFTPEQKALVDMAKGDKKAGGITSSDMEAYKKLNAEAGPKGFAEPNAVRGPETHPLRTPQSTPGPGQKPHGHVGPVDHIPVKP